MSPRKSFLKRSAIKRSNKPIRKVNPKAKAKRVIGYRKMLASPEYKAAREAAMIRAGGRCEVIEPMLSDWVMQSLSVKQILQRCNATEDLHAHHKSYPKTRPLEASDLLIVCQSHHIEIESRKMHKTRMF